MLRLALAGADLIVRLRVGQETRNAAIKLMPMLRVSFTQLLVIGLSTARFEQ